MRIILSSNPYRDKGLRTALEADRILRKAGAETVLCLPFVPKKGAGTGPSSTPPGTPPSTGCPSWG